MDLVRPGVVLQGCGSAMIQHAKHNPAVPAAPGSHMPLQMVELRLQPKGGGHLEASTGHLLIQDGRAQPALRAQEAPTHILHMAALSWVRDPPGAVKEGLGLATLLLILCQCPPYFVLRGVSEDIQEHFLVWFEFCSFSFSFNF